MRDRSMSNRRADIEGESGNLNKKSRAQQSEGGDAYGSPANRSIQDARRLIPPLFDSLGKCRGGNGGGVLVSDV